MSKKLGALKIECGDNIPTIEFLETNNRPLKGGNNKSYERKNSIQIFG